MRRGLLRAAAGSAVLAGLLVPGQLTSSAVAAPATADDDRVAAAVSELGACLASGAPADVLLVLDTSPSLEDTDPLDQRVAAATYFTQGLAAYAEDSGAEIDLAVAGFADSFALSTDWLPVTSSADRLTDEITTYADRDGGFETDYWTAVTGARKALDERQGEERRCQAWVWFSDGSYDLDKRDTDEEVEVYGATKPYGPDVRLTDDDAEHRIEEAGTADLCRKGGAADQLRGEGIWTFAIGLGSGDADQYTLMNGVATGDACGQTRGRTVGAFLPAEDVTGLVLAFDAISDPDHPPTGQVTGVCAPGAQCDERHTFTLDASIERVHVVAGTSVAGYTAELLSPAGRRVSIALDSPEQPTKVPGATIAHAWVADQTVQIDLTQRGDDARAAGWAGEWSLVFRGPADPKVIARSSIRLFADIVPTVTGLEEELRSTDRPTLTFGLAREDGGTAIDPTSLAGDVSFTAELRTVSGEQLEVVATDKSGLSSPVELDLAGVGPGSVTLHLIVRLTTAAPGGGRGTELEPRSIDVPRTVLPPADYPTLPTTVSFGSTEESGTFDASLALTGAGCAWLDGTEVLTLPEGIDAAPVTSSASDADGCAEGDLPLSLRLDEVGSGLVSGELTVQTRSTDPGAEAVPVVVRYELEVERPRDESTFWLVLVLGILGGLLVPVVLLYVIKWRTAQIPGGSLLVGTLQGPVRDGAAAFLAEPLTERDLRGISLPGNRRLLTLADGVVLRTRAGLALTEPGFCLLADRVSASSARPGATRRDHARLPLDVQDRWLVALDPHDPRRGPVQVVVLVAPGSGKLQELIRDARARVPEIVDGMRSRLKEEGAGPDFAPPPPPSPSLDDWGAGPSPSRPAGPSGGAGGTGGTSGTGTSGWDEW